MIRSSEIKVRDASQSAYMKLLYCLCATISPKAGKGKQKDKKATILGYD